MDAAFEEYNSQYCNTTIGLPPEVQVEAIELLNQTLASSIDLWLHVKCSAWNVRGISFISLHRLFNDIAAYLVEAIDVFGERVAALGGQAQGTIPCVATQSKIPNYPNGLQSQEDYLLMLSRHIAVYSIHLRHTTELVEGLGELGTVDTYRNASLQIDMFLRLLEAHL